MWARTVEKKINKLIQMTKCMDYIYTLTDNGVSLFNITCNKWGGNIGGPDTFSHGLVCGTSWEYSLSALFTAFSLSLAKA